MANELKATTVSQSIMDAEETLYKAIVAWKKVEEEESIIANDSNTPEDEKALAWRGVGYARITVQVLEGLYGKD